MSIAALGDDLEDEFDETAAPPQRRNGEEVLYVSEEYKIFMITGRPDEFTRDPNHICVRPFHAFPAETVEKMRTNAKPWTEKTANDCRITIRPTDTTLDLKDLCNGVTSRFPISELDEDVRHELLYIQHIRVFNGSDNRDERVDPWQKYAGLPAKDVEAAVTANGDVQVSRPLTLKKPGGLAL